jgi:protein involved in polysaccharide export with SLBB domain
MAMGVDDDDHGSVPVSRPSRITHGAEINAGAVAMTALATLLVACGHAFSQVAVRPPTEPPPALAGPASTTNREYRIGIGDQLDIKFFYNPELNEQVIVRPDGRISLQLIPEIIVSDLTPAALTKQLTEYYSKDLKQPQVTVIVRAFGSQRVYVDGEVGRPGMIPILGTMTTLQAIAEAGGMKDTARTGDVIIIRRGANDKPLAFRVDIRKAREGSDFSQDVSLSPFDIVYVPRSRVANVNLWMDQYIRKNIPIPFSIYYGHAR